MNEVDKPTDEGCVEDSRMGLPRADDERGERATSLNSGLLALVEDPAGVICVTLVDMDAPEPRRCRLGKSSR